MPKKTVWFSPTKIIPSIPEADRPVIEKVGFQFWPKDQTLQCLYKALGRDTKSLKPETIRELRNYIDRISRNALPVGDFYVVQFLQELYDRGGKATIDELPKVTPDSYRARRKCQDCGWTRCEGRYRYFLTEEGREFLDDYTKTHPKTLA